MLAVPSGGRLTGVDTQRHHAVLGAERQSEFWRCSGGGAVKRSARPRRARRVQERTGSDEEAT
jgi:hypothetical protein